MALTRKALAAMGIEEAQADEIIKMHTDVVNEIKDERDLLKLKESKLEAVQKELDGLKEEMSKGDRSPYKKKFEDLEIEHNALKEEFDSYKADIDAKAARDKVRAAYRKQLIEAGVSEKRLDSVLKLAEVDGKFDTVVFGDDGAVKDAEKLTEAIKSDYGDYIVTESARGADTAKPPANNGGQGGTGLSRAAQLAAKYHNNLYGESKED